METCRICLEGFQVEVLIELRAELYFQVTGFEVLPTEPRRICIPCNDEFDRMHTFWTKCQRAESVLKADGLKIEMQEEDMVVDSPVEIPQEIVETEWKYECENCSAKLETLGGLKVHCRKNHKGEERHECECGRRFFHLTELDRHLPVCSKKKTKTKKELEKSICCHCGKIMASHYLDRHIKDVHEKIGTAEFICDICDDKYRTKVGILAHLKRKHMNCLYDCHFCQEVFPSYGIRRTHEVRFHTFNFKYQCNVCEHKFIARRDLIKHRVTHTGEKNFKCDICGLHVSRKSVLDLHKATHSDIRSFVCGICSAAFKTKKALRSHKNIHEERKYECPVCSQKFLVNQAMRQHVQKRHPDFVLPPPGTIMNKSAIKRIMDVSEKYNLKVEKLLTKKLPKSDIMEEPQYEIQEHVQVEETVAYTGKSSSLLHLKQEFSVDTPILIQTYADIDSIETTSIIHHQ